MAESVEHESYGHAFGFHHMTDTLEAIIGPQHNNHSAAFDRIGRKKDEEERKNMIQTLHYYLLAVGIFGIGNFVNTFLVLKSTEALAPGWVSTASNISAFLYVLHNVGAAKRA